MKPLRSHIIGCFITLLIGTGLSLHAVRPACTGQVSDVFVGWVTQMAKYPDASMLKKELKDLRQSSENFYHIIKKASQIISRNNGAFDFSGLDTPVAGHLYSLLLLEWNQFQTDNAMSGLTPPVVKPIWMAQHDQSVSLNPLRGWSGISNFLILFSLSVFSLESVIYIVSLAPMSSGIAIGAP